MTKYQMYQKKIPRVIKIILVLMLVMTSAFYAGAEIGFNKGHELGHLEGGRQGYQGCLNDLQAQRDVGVFPL